MTNINISDKSIAQPNSVTPTTPPGKQAVGQESIEQKGTAFPAVEESAKTELARNKLEQERQVDREKGQFEATNKKLEAKDIEADSVDVDDVVRKATAERQKSERDQELLRKVAIRDENRAEALEVEASRQIKDVSVLSEGSSSQNTNERISDNVQSAVVAAQSSNENKGSIEAQSATRREDNNDVLVAKQRAAELRLVEEEVSKERAVAERSRIAASDARFVLNEQRLLEVEARGEARAAVLENNTAENNREERAEFEPLVQTNGVDIEVIEDVNRIETSAAIAAEIFKNVSLETEETVDPFLITNAFTIDVDA